MLEQELIGDRLFSGKPHFGAILKADSRGNSPLLRMEDSTIKLKWHRCYRKTIQNLKRGNSSLSLNGVHYWYIEFREVRQEGVSI